MTTLSIDLGGSRIKLATITDGLINVQTIFDVPDKISFTQILDLVASHEHAIWNKPIKGVGIAFAGIVDAHFNAIISTKKISRCTGFQPFFLEQKRIWSSSMGIE